MGAAPGTREKNCAPDAASMRRAAEADRDPISQAAPGCNSGPMDSAIIGSRRPWAIVRRFALPPWRLILAFAHADEGGAEIGDPFHDGGGEFRPMVRPQASINFLAHFDAPFPSALRSG